MTNPSDPMALPRPEIGRPTDPRVTPEFLASRPEFRGLDPFDPERDVNLLGEIEMRLKLAWARAGNVVSVGTRAERRATQPTMAVIWRESDTGLLLSYLPDVGWRGPYGENIDNPPPPPPADTGVY